MDSVRFKLDSHLAFTVIMRIFPPKKKPKLNFLFSQRLQKGPNEKVKRVSNQDFFRVFSAPPQKKSPHPIFVLCVCFFPMHISALMAAL